MNKKVVARLAAVLSGTMLLTVFAYVNQNPTVTYDKNVTTVAAQDDTIKKGVSVLPNELDAVSASMEQNAEQTTEQVQQTAQPVETTETQSVPGTTEATETAENTQTPTETVEEQPAEEPVNEYANIAVAQVDNYVNIRSSASEDGEILGKLYNKSVGTISGEENGWYQITSGSVTGYVKSEFVVVGDEELIKSVQTRYATVTTTTLFVRSEPTTESSIIYMLPEGDDLVAIDESNEGWVKVNTEAGEGFVSADYVTMSTEYVEAESKEEEEARLAAEEAERKAALAAAQKQMNANSSKSSGSSEAVSLGTGSGSETGRTVVGYASQFVGNPYVYGGTSLTNGTDCSGFVMGVYGHFGVSLPHSSAAIRSAGYSVSYADAQPGDIICYSGHVAIYAGNGQIIHAANESQGICYGSATYTNILSIRRIF